MMYKIYSSQIKTTYPQLTCCMFPFTPIEIHSGVLIGQERILVARSGIFGWGDSSRARLRAFDAEGHERTGPENQAALVELTVGDERRFELKLPHNWVACLQRIK